MRTLILWTIGFIIIVAVIVSVTYLSTAEPLRAVTDALN